ncbi:hypothetical protein QQP08_012842 [Theobroma cacao]|nr:hypothetical protein QQP08_012842 [Theobroma cacao]
MSFFYPSCAIRSKLCADGNCRQPKYDNPNQFLGNRNTAYACNNHPILGLHSNHSLVILNFKESHRKISIQKEPYFQIACEKGQP